MVLACARPCGRQAQGRVARPSMPPTRVAGLHGAGMASSFWGVHPAIKISARPLSLSGRSCWGTSRSRGAGTCVAGVPPSVPSPLRGAVGRGAVPQGQWSLKARAPLQGGRRGGCGGRQGVGTTLPAALVADAAPSGDASGEAAAADDPEARGLYRVDLTVLLEGDLAIEHFGGEEKRKCVQVLNDCINEAAREGGELGAGDQGLAFELQYVQDIGSSAMGPGQMLFRGDAPPFVQRKLQHPHVVATIQEGGLILLILLVVKQLLSPITGAILGPITPESRRSIAGAGTALSLGAALAAGAGAASGASGMAASVVKFSKAAGLLLGAACLFFGVALIAPAAEPPTAAAGPSLAVDGEAAGEPSREQVVAQAVVPGLPGGGMPALSVTLLQADGAEDPSALHGGAAAGGAAGDTPPADLRWLAVACSLETSGRGRSEAVAGLLAATLRDGKVTEAMKAAGLPVTSAALAVSGEDGALSPGAGALLVRPPGEPPVEVPGWPTGSGVPYRVVCISALLGFCLCFHLQTNVIPAMNLPAWVARPLTWLCMVWEALELTRGAFTRPRYNPATPPAGDWGKELLWGLCTIIMLSVIFLAPSGGKLDGPAGPGVRGGAGAGGAATVATLDTRSTAQTLAALDAPDAVVSGPQSPLVTLSYSMFMDLLEEGAIKKVQFQGNQLTMKLNPPSFLVEKDEVPPWKGGAARVGEAQRRLPVVRQVTVVDENGVEGSPCWKAAPGGVEVFEPRARRSPTTGRWETFPEWTNSVKRLYPELSANEGFERFRDRVIDRELSKHVYSVTLLPGEYAGEKLAEELQERGVRISAAPLTPSIPLMDRLFQVLNFLLPVVVIALIARQMGDGGAGRGAAAGQYEIGGPETKTFADVAGCDEAKEELREIVDFLKSPQRYAALGARAPRGVLLVGPPGTGKTLLARAAAGEASVPFFSAAGSSFDEVYVGRGAARVRELFKRVRMAAPCIVFIDELDAVGAARTRMGSGDGGPVSDSQTLNQLLTEMDGFGAGGGAGEEVIVLAATNRPEMLDPALRRPGRFDRTVSVSAPDKRGRLDILGVHARNSHLRLGTRADLSEVAGQTMGFTGADLGGLLNEAALLAARSNVRAIDQEHLQESLERVAGGIKRPTFTVNPRERRVVAFHECGHALVGAACMRSLVALDAAAMARSLTPTERAAAAEAPPAEGDDGAGGLSQVRKVSIVPRGDAALGYTLQIPEEDRYLRSAEELRGEICVLMGGRACEQLVYGRVTTGSSDDLQRATSSAEAMVASYGMSETVGPRALERASGSRFLGGGGSRRDFGGDVSSRADQEVGALLARAEGLAVEVLGANRGLVDEMATALLEEEVLQGEALEAFLSRAAATPALEAWLAGVGGGAEGM